MRALLGVEAGAGEVLAPASHPADMAGPASSEFVQAPAALDAAPITETVVTAPLDPIPLPPEPASPQQEAAHAAPPEPVSLRDKTEAGMLRKPAIQDNDAADAMRAPPGFDKIVPKQSVLHDSGPAPAAPRRPSAGIPVSTPDRPRVNTSGKQSDRRRSNRAQRWGMIAGAAIVVLAAGGALFSWMQQNDARDLVPLSLPPAERATTGLDSGETVVAPSPVATATTPTDPAANAQAADAAPVGAPDKAPPAALPPAPTAPQATSPAVAAADGTGAMNDAIINGTTYKLLIKPWGTVYVDGIDRGVSPPVKRLTLGPGQHTIRIVNPNFPEHVMTVDAGLRETATLRYDFTAQAE